MLFCKGIIYKDIKKTAVRRKKSMKQEIKITKKAPRRGDDGYKIVSVRMKDETIEQLDAVSAQTDRSRNEVIKLLLEAALKIVSIEDTEK